MTESTPAATPFILRSFILPLLIYTDESILNLINKFKLIETVRYIIITAFTFFLNIISSALNSDTYSNSGGYSYGYGKCTDAGDGRLQDDTCIARALNHILAIVNEIPVSSRKYEIVRSYAEKLMDENLEVEYEPLRRVNAVALAGAFSRTLEQLEMAAAADGGECDGEEYSGEDAVKKNSGGGYFVVLDRVVKTVGYFGDVAWTRFVKGKTRFGGSGEKLAAELLWLAKKLKDCGSVDEAVCQWASASKLGFVALSAQPRLQGSLVKLSVYLFKQVASMGSEDDEEGAMEELRKVKMKMLMSWLPFLCRSSIGTDAPVLSINEKTELENVLGELIMCLKHEEQESVLSLWLHHFTHCLSSDWLNLHQYYASWCTTSRKLLILDDK
ncbi:uncharacterized protein LOC143575170 [Bidens hawaiensis]|uniref:uncharacterized protein LOC143575170 n=1 Tax=Bidens hawaiensis TaxID=980011 RepID=UPI00404B7593